MTSVAVAELLLNLVWFGIAAAAFLLVLPSALARRGTQATAALLCCAALLFPIISVSDDLSGDRDTYETFAAVLVAIAFIIGLIAIARVASHADLRVAFVLAKHADPRSPPRR
jgi:hypothetical protein